MIKEQKQEKRGKGGGGVGVGGRIGKGFGIDGSTRWKGREEQEMLRGRAK